MANIARISAGLTPKRDGTATTGDNIARLSAGLLPAISSSSGTTYYVGCTGNIPAGASILYTDLHSGISTYYVTVTGEMPSGAGVVADRFSLTRVVQGNVPAQTGGLHRVISKSTTGVLPGQGGNVSRSIKKYITGDVPSSTGRLLRRVRTALTGIVPAIDGVLFTKGVLRQTVTGAVSIASGVITALYKAGGGVVAPICNCMKMLIRMCI